jgi:putative membrane protein
MFLEILLFVLLGIVLGFFTGLAPGIHPNTIFAFTLSLSFLFIGFPIQAILAFVVSLAVSNTFFDFIPSIFFGAPEEDSAISVLPGHRMLLKGRGYEAIFLTAMGGLGVMFLTVMSLPFLFVLLPSIYFVIKPVIHIILITAVLWMVWMERGTKKRLAAASIFLASGIFGFITLNSLPSDGALFPALTGLFGLSTILTSIMEKTRIPPQKIRSEVHGNWLKGSLAGWIAGMISGLLPGLGSSQAGIIAAQALKAKMKEFLIALGGINTSNMFFTFIVFYLLGKTRSGAVWMISQIMDQFTVQDMGIIVVVGVITALVSAVATIKAARLLLGFMRKLNYTKTMIITACVLSVMIVALSGPLGVMISVTGTFLGLLAVSTGIKRTNLMGFLILPTILYFSGFNPFFSGILW